MVADAGEPLCYSGMEGQSIQALLARCAIQGADALYGVMVDMYSSGGLMDVRVIPGDKLAELMPLLRRRHVFRRRPQRHWKETAICRYSEGRAAVCS